MPALERVDFLRNPQQSPLWHWFCSSLWVPRVQIFSYEPVLPKAKAASAIKSWLQITMAHVFIKTLVSNHHTEGHRCFEIDFQAAVRDFQSMLVCPLLHGLHPRIPFCVITLVGFEWFGASARCGCALKLGTLRRKSIAFLIKLAVSIHFYCFVLCQCDKFWNTPMLKTWCSTEVGYWCHQPSGSFQWDLYWSRSWSLGIPRWVLSWWPRNPQNGYTVDVCMDMYGYVCICCNVF